MLWSGSEVEVNEFMSIINQSTFNLKFTMLYNKQNIPFFDIYILPPEGGTIGTFLYCKPMARNTVLHAQSKHPCCKVFLTAKTYG